MVDKISFIDREKARFHQGDSREKALTFSLDELEGMINQIITRDVYSNKVLEEMLDKFLNKNFEEKKYLKDDFIQILDYTIGALEKIAKSPKMKLEKISELQDINKVSKIDFNTIVWLASKPGKTVADKVGIKGKILAPKNQYTVDKKENRIVNYYFKKVYEILEARYKFYKLSGEECPKELKNLYKKLFAVRREFIKNDIFSLKRPLDFEPNNTLIDHRDYSVVNRGLNIYNNLIEKKYTETQNVLQKYIIVTFFKSLNKLTQLEGMNIVTKPININSIISDGKCDFELFYENKKTYKIEAVLNKKAIIFKIKELGFNKNTKLAINKNELNKTCFISFELLNKSNRYLIAESLNKKYQLSQNGIALLVNDIVSRILNELGEVNIKTEKNVEDLDKENYINFASPIPILNNKLLDITVYDETYNTFLKTNDFHYLKNRFLNYNDTDNLVKFIKEIKGSIGLSSKSTIIYSAIENIDTDEHKKIYSIMNSSFVEGYPIWRSILASYFLDLQKNYLQENKKYTFLDLNISNPSLNIIIKKKGSYEHHPALELDEEIEKKLQEINLNSFLRKYLEKYLKKYKINLSTRIIENLLSTGKLYDCIFNGKKHILLLPQKQILLEKDDEIIFEYLIKSKGKLINILKELKLPNLGEVIIISDYLNKLNDFEIIKENNLGFGKEVILNKIKNNKIVWNEFLPNLSLETLDENHFYELNLIKNEAIDLTLGKEKIIEISEELILPANNDVIYFPLISEDSFNKKNYSLEIKSSSFPLKENLVVNLKIGYSYGSEDPYRIIIEPKDKNIKLDTKSKWIENKKDFKIKSIGFPEIVSTATEEEIKNTLKNIERAAYYSNDEKLNTLLKRNKNRVRRFVAKQIDSGRIDFITQELLPKKESVLIKKFVNSEYNSELRKNIKIFLSTFGSLMDFIIPFSEENKDIYVLFLYRFSNLKFSKIYISKGVQFKKIVEVALLDRSFMTRLMEEEGEMIKGCLNHVRYQLSDLNKNFDEKYRDNIDKGWIVTNLFRDSLEFILSILTTSSSLPTSTKNIHSILKDIKSIDRKIQIDEEYKILKENFDKNIRVKFELEKTEDLKNMSDLAYAVYNLITGRDGSNSIKISSLADDN